MSVSEITVKLYISKLEARRGSKLVQWLVPPADEGCNITFGHWREASLHTFVNYLPPLRSIAAGHSLVLVAAVRTK